jgi:hypothetical protein
MIEITWSTESKMFTVWHLTEKCSLPLPRAMFHKLWYTHSQWGWIKMQYLTQQLWAGAETLQTPRQADAAGPRTTLGPEQVRNILWAPMQRGQELSHRSLQTSQCSTGNLGLSKFCPQKDFQGPPLDNLPSLGYSHPVVGCSCWTWILIVIVLGSRTFNRCLGFAFHQLMIQQEDAIPWYWTFQPAELWANKFCS